MNNEYRREPKSLLILPNDIPDLIGTTIGLSAPKTIPLNFQIDSIHQKDSIAHKSRGIDKMIANFTANK
jgi:hypothetical protein